MIACEHAASRVTRTEANGRITVLASQAEGKELNSLKDVVVKSDGAIYFSDPPMAAWPTTASSASPNWRFTASTGSPQTAQRQRCWRAISGDPCSAWPEHRHRNRRSTSLAPSWATCL
jgi:hypothetical protein